MRLCLALFVPFALGLPAVAQGPYEWRLHTGTARPPARNQHVMAYDAARSQTLLFGGFNGGYLNDTWVFDASGWRRLTPAHNPVARARAAMAYDPVRERVVLIGGAAGTVLSDVWEWDGIDWTQVSTAMFGVDDHGAACFNPLVGGVFYSSGMTNLVWNGTSWRSLTFFSPSVVYDTEMVFDAAMGGVLTTLGSDTMLFRAGSGWTRLTYAESFSLRDYAMAIDPILGRPILQGGSGGIGSSSRIGAQETFLWNGSYWGRIALNPTQYRGFHLHAMAFDLERRVFVMFGGDVNHGPDFTDETWELAALSPQAEFHGFGAGCAGVGRPAPFLGAETSINAVPVLGGSFTLRVDGVPPTQRAWLALGISDANWSGTGLPFPLGMLGMPGCELLVSPDILEPIGAAGASGRVWSTLVIPGGVEFLGARFFVQSLVLAPGANPAGVLWTNGGRGVIGARP